MPVVRVTRTNNGPEKFAYQILTSKKHTTVFMKNQQEKEHMKAFLQSPLKAGGTHSRMDTFATKSGNKFQFNRSFEAVSASQKFNKDSVHLRSLYKNLFKD